MRLGHACCEGEWQGFALNRLVATTVGAGFPGVVCVQRVRQVETLLPLVYSEGVGKGLLHLPDVPRLLSEGPARVYGLYPKKGAIEVGSDADLVVFDPDERWEISANGLHMRTDFSPYEGWEITGRVVTTIARGEVVYSGGTVSAERGRGRYLFREPGENRV